MEQPDLVPARVTARRVAALLVVGLALAGARAGMRPSEPRAIVVEIPAEASLLDEASAVREEVLLAEARRLGWDRSDPVVLRHLVKSMRAAGASGDDDALLEEAWALGLDRTDPVVRQQLLDRAGRALVDDLEPAPGELEAWLAEHPERFRRPEQVTFAQAFRAEHDPDFGQRLADVAPEDAAAQGDPLLGLRPVDTATPTRAGQWLGPDAEAALAAPSQGWVGPVASPYGEHWFLVLERVPAVVPPLADIEAEVRADWERAVAPERGRQRLDALVAAWDVEVVRR